MAEVYRARDTHNHEPVAIKILTHKSVIRGATLGFQKEFHTLTTLRHPNIIQAYEYGVSDDGRPYYTMQLLEGQEIQALDAADIAQTCSTLRDIASALAYLHSRRLIHRDVTHHNVRVGRDGRAVLFDFGILSTMGTPSRVQGTPPFIPPEALQGVPLDDRVDLYGLGALAYRMLTGRHAFPARSAKELGPLWSAGLAPPDKVAKNIPKPLSDLVVALLARDRRMRPASAAEVIAALGLIGKLRRMPESAVSHGYLASAALVGREHELQSIGAMLSEAKNGEGSAVIVRAESGMGKSRLLREIGLSAQVSGFSSLYIDASHGKGAYGCLRQIIQKALQHAPIAAQEAADEDRPILEKIAPELARGTLGHAPLPWDESSNDVMLQIRQACLRYLQNLARSEPLLIALDDAQRADEGSLAVLANLALQINEHPILLVCGVRTNDTIRSESALEKLREHTSLLSLKGLDTSEVTAFIAATFHETIATPDLASWMHKTCNGSPLRLTELARQLVAQEVLLLRAGEWSFRKDFRKTRVPISLSEAMDEHIAELPASARALAQVLAVSDRSVSLQWVDAVWGGSMQEAFGALDVLVQELVVIHASNQAPEPTRGEGETTDMPSAVHYCIRHDGLKEALSRSLDEEEKQSLHLKVAVRLIEEAASSGEIGFHLLAGGRADEALNYLERAGIEHFEMESFHDSIAPLEAALKIVQGDKRATEREMDLRRRLVVAGNFSSRDVVARYVDSSLALAWKHSGMQVARALGPVLGRNLAFLVGLSWSNAKRMFQSHKGPKPTDAIGDLFTYFTAKTTLSVHSFAIGTVFETVARMRVLKVFRGRLPYAMVQLCEGLSQTFTGDVAKQLDAGETAFAAIKSDSKTKIDESDRIIALGIARNLRLFAHMLRCDPAVLEEAPNLRTLGLPKFSAAADYEIALVRRGQGYEAEALQILRDLRERELQSGAGWMVTTMLSWQSSLCFAFTGDAVGLRHSLDEMRTMAGEGINCIHHIELAEAEFALLHGELSKGTVALLRAKKLKAEFLQIPIMAVESELFLAMGQLAQATKLAHEGMALCQDSPKALPIYQARFASVLAWSIEQAQAHELIESTLANLKDWDNPAANGRLLECGALIADQNYDTQSFQDYQRRMAETYEPTKNPVLLRRLERLRNIRLQPEQLNPVATDYKVSTITLGDTMPAP